MRTIAFLASFFIVAVSALVVSLEMTGYAWIEDQPGMYKPESYVADYKVAQAGGRPLPQFSTKEIDWNFASTDELFTAITERSGYMWQVGKFTEAQYNSMLDAIAVLRLGIEQRCVSEQDVKVALRLLGGANRGEKFKEQYDKAKDCLREKQQLKVEEPKEPKPLPATPFEGKWQVLFGQGEDSYLVVEGFNATANVTIDGIVYTITAPIEIVENGFNFVVDPFELRVFEYDPVVGVYKGKLVVENRSFPVIFRRVVV